VPELPEVEMARRLAARVAIGRRIERVWCADDPIVFEGLGPARVRRALLGRRVLDVQRRGKHFWLVLDRRPWLLVHFGMSGGLHVPAGVAVRLVSSNHRPPAWPPPFMRLGLGFGDGREMAIADARRLGRIRLRHDPASEPPVSLLGFDALTEVPPAPGFAARLRARTAPVKAVLLDQSFAAGVGNWIADEILYQARIDPRRRAHTLTVPEAARIRAAMLRVVTTAVRLRADSDRFPRAWLFHVRWGRAAGAVTARGQRIRHDTINGRTTAWVPSVQR
jgi:formamidopyrimidine-DNA glycosylase